MSEPTANAEHESAPKILFLHLPKTAGTALHDLLVRQYGEGDVTRPLGTIGFDDALVDYEDFQVICGHLMASPGARLPADRVALTVLRDPIDRFLSQYNFLKFNVGHGMVDARIREGTIDEYVQTLRPGDMSAINLQTEILYPLGTDERRLLSWEERAAAAKRALDGFDFIGVHEELDDFICVLGARFGWPRDSLLKRHNVTDRREGASLSAGCRETLERLLQPDMDVFRHAQARFRELRRSAIGAVRRDESSPVQRRVEVGVVPAEFGDRRLEITSVTMIGSASGVGVSMVGELMSIDVDFVVHEETSEVSAGFLIRDGRGLPMYGTNTWLLGETCTVAPGHFRAHFEMINRLHAGPYTIDAHLVRNRSFEQGCHHWKEQVVRFDVVERATPHFEGRVLMDPSWSLAPLERGSIGKAVTVVPAGRIPFAPNLGRVNAPLRAPSARILVLNLFAKTVTGMESLVELDLRNTGVEAWPCDGKQAVSLCYHWQRDDGSTLVFDGIRTRLPRDVAPGQSIRMNGFVRAPLDACGNLRLVWTLLQEGVAWFDSIDKASATSMDVLVT